MSLFNLPKQFDPDFSSPKKKPFKGVEIDSTNHLSKGLHFCLNKGDELVSAKNLTNFTGSARIERAAYQHSTDTNQNYADILAVPKIDGPQTLLIIFQNADGTTDGYIGGANIVSHGIFNLNRQSSNGIGVATPYQQYLSTPGPTDVFDGGFHTVGFSTSDKRSASYTDTIYIDGKAEVSEVNAWGETPFGSSSFRMGSAGTWAKITGETPLVCMWNRLLTTKEIESFHANPYQILKPAAPIYYPIPLASGGGSISNSLQCNWNSLEGVSSSNLILWNLLNNVSSSTRIDWDALHSLVSNTAFEWSMVEGVNVSTGIDWDLLAALSNVTNSTRIDWSLLEKLSNATNINWAMLQSTTTAANLRWNLLTQIGQSLGLEWNLKENINSVIQLDWDLLSSLLSVSNNVQINWDLIGKINSQLAAQWNLLESVGISTDLRWDLSIAIANEVQANWALSSGAISSLDLSWDSIATTSKGVQFNWSIQSDQARIPINMMVVMPENRIMKILH